MTTTRWIIMHATGATALLLAAGAAMAQASPSHLDRHCAQQPAAGPARQQLIERMTAQVRSGTPDERSAAADTLSCFGEASRAAVPDMIRLFSNTTAEIQANAVAATARLGSTAVPALTEALGSMDLRVRNNASRALGRIGPPARDALPRLQQLTSARDPAYSPLAELAVRRIQPEGPPK